MLPVILIEVVMVFGGALLFAWWQLRDLDREKARSEQKKRDEAAQQANTPTASDDPA